MSPNQKFKGSTYGNGSEAMRTLILLVPFARRLPRQQIFFVLEMNIQQHIGWSSKRVVNLGANEYIKKIQM